MAVRPQHTHNGGIVERRLRPIYDWLDNGNNKKALQEAEKVLKKSPSLQAARALKALAMFRLGKGPEAHAVLEALADEKPSDDTTLQAMTILYRESQQLQKVCELYEAAIKAEPTSEELHSHLFMSYVRVGDYRSQQRSAMALYKIAPKNPYYFWVVMSVVLQAKTAEDTTKKGILLSLAQRMVDNFITDNKMEAEQEARLYIMILELQEKWEDILNFIEGPLYPQLVPGSTTQACIPYLKKLGLWQRLNLLCKELLWDNQDRWDYYLPYFDSVFELMKTDCDPDSGADDTPEKCHEFICQLVESFSSGRTLRGPYLARLELWRRLSAGGDPTALLGSGLALCIQYLRVFASKSCAVPDLKPYLAMIPQKEREESSRDFLTCLGFDENSEPESQDDIQRHVSCLRAWRLTSARGAAAERRAAAAALRACYERCAARGLLAATPTECGAADGYGALAAHYYFDAAVQEQNAGPIVEALSLLELVLHNSPSNVHIKLLLITLYHVLGNASAAESIYQRLEPKHIQLVSLGWVHAARCAPALAPARALRLLADAHAFHKHYAKESVEHLTYAYKYGTFEKLVELGAWSARLGACAWCALAGRERALLPLLAGPPAPLHAPARLPHPPADNRDLDAIVSWEPPQCADPELKARTFEQDVAYLRLKDGLVSSIALCIECADGRAAAEKRAQLAELAGCVAALSRAADRCRELCRAPAAALSLSAPFPSRIIAFVNSPVPYRELYTSALGMVCELCGGRARDGRRSAERLRGLLLDSRELLRGAPAATAWGLRDSLETFANYLEFIGVITFLLGVCNELTAPTNAKKSKKKTNQSPEQAQTAATLGELNAAVQQTIGFLGDTFDNWPEYEEHGADDDAAPADGGYRCPVGRKLSGGHREMLADVRSMLDKKLKYLKSLQ